MLTVISPAKTMDFDTPPSIDKATIPDQLNRSRELIKILKKESPRSLSKMMGISDKLAELNAQRFKAWKPSFNQRNAKQSILAFRGDVYIGLDVDAYSARDLNFVQKNLRILSGLYGVLRPLDLIQPYRLEMGTKLPNKRGKDLYAFWNDAITKQLGDTLASHRNKTLVNLASNEYFKAIKPDLLPGKVITPIFKEYHKGSYKVLAFFAKKARGQMATFIVQNRITTPENIKKFDVDGYQFSESHSTELDWVFTRRS